MYQTALDEQQFQAGGRDRYPEVRAEKVWEAVFKNSSRANSVSIRFFTAVSTSSA
jgi:hypothetical protein